MPNPINFSAMASGSSDFSCENVQHFTGDVENLRTKSSNLLPINQVPLLHIAVTGLLCFKHMAVWSYRKLVGSRKAAE